MAKLLPDVRTSVGELQDILDTDLTEGQLNAMINTAYTIVQDHLVGHGLSSALLGQIECWLSAHFASIRDQRAASEGIAGEYNVTYQGKTDMGFRSTFYGQQAIAMDTTGRLASLADGDKEARFRVHTTEGD